MPIAYCDTRLRDIMMVYWCSQEGFGRGGSRIMVNAAGMTTSKNSSQAPL
jgi:hypothetical protein